MIPLFKMKRERFSARTEDECVASQVDGEIGFSYWDYFKRKPLCLSLRNCFNQHAVYTPTVSNRFRGIYHPQPTIREKIEIWAKSIKQT